MHFKNRGVFHSQIRCTDFKSSKKSLNFWDFSDFLGGLRGFFWVNNSSHSIKINPFVLIITSYPKTRVVVQGLSIGPRFIKTKATSDWSMRSKSRKRYKVTNCDTKPVCFVPTNGEGAQQSALSVPWIRPVYGLVVCRWMASTSSDICLSGVTQSADFPPVPLLPMN